MRVGRSGDDSLNACSVTFQRVNGSEASLVADAQVAVGFGVFDESSCVDESGKVLTRDKVICNAWNLAFPRFARGVWSVETSKRDECECSGHGAHGKR